MSSDIVNVWYHWRKCAAQLEFMSDWRYSRDGYERQMWRQVKADYAAAEKGYREAYRALPPRLRAKEYRRLKAERINYANLKSEQGQVSPQEGVAVAQGPHPEAGG